MQPLKKRVSAAFMRLPKRTTAVVLTGCALSLFQNPTFTEEAQVPLTPQTPPPKEKKKVRRKKVKKNPGKFEELNKPIMDVLEIQNFQGARFGWNVPLFQEEAPQMQNSTAKQLIVGTNINMGSPNDPAGSSVELSTISLFHGGQYLLMGQYQLGQQGQTGRLNGRAIAKPKGQPMSGVLQFSITPDPNYNNIVLETDYKGHDWTVGASVMPGIGVLSYVQRLTPVWSAGVCGFNQFSQASWLSYALTYSTMKRKTDGEQVTVSVNGRGPLSIGYAHKIDEGLTLSTELQFSPATLDSTARAGALYTKKTFMYRANIDSSGKVASALELQTASGPRLAFSGELKHETNEATFGLGVSLG